MKLNYQDFKIQALQFLEELFSLIDHEGIKVEKHWNIDHLCFRVSTDDDYLKFKNLFLTFSTLLIESEVNGRLISTFKFAEPIQYKNWSIELVELPAPKKGKITLQGFEHIEIVVDVPLNEIKKLYPSCTFDEGGLHKEFNQELEISFGKLAIKFHHLSLESVINVEKNSKLFLALHGSKVLKTFKNYNPLVSGTFPLDIAVKNSDIDIIMSSENLDALADLIEENYKTEHAFKLQRSQTNVIAEFQSQGFVFELYAEQKPASLQNAHLHFILEERLLKLASTDFKKQIVQLKEAGVKTEPAFAEALGLTGDAYQALLDIRKKSEAELLTLLP